MSFYPTIIDVSHHQGTIDWNTVKGNISFAILRVQDGTVLDRQLSRNVSECQRLGIPYYLYGFYRGGGATEANRMVARAKAAGATKCLGYICDLEVGGFNKDNIRAFFNALPGLNNGLYIAHNLYSQYGVGHGEKWVWIPRYGSNNGQPSTRPSYPCDLWQFTSAGYVPGISGKVDCNACINKELSFFTQGDDDDMEPIDVWNYKNTSVNGDKDAYQLLYEIHRSVGFGNPDKLENVASWNYKNKGINGNSDAYELLTDARNRIVKMDTTITAMSAAIETLSKSVGADPQTIAQAVSDAVEKKLEAIDLSVTVNE